MNEQPVKSGWVVVTPTVCQGDTLAWTESSEADESDVFPIVYNTEEEAYKEIAEEIIRELQEFIDGERELDETNFCAEEYVARFEYFADGTMVVWGDQEPIIETTLEDWRKSR